MSHRLPPFLALLGEPARARLARSPQLSELLQAALDRAGARLPATVRSYLAERFPGAEDLQAALTAWRTDELRLCHDGIGGDPGAVASLEARLRPVIGSTLARLRIAAPLRDEIEQQLLVQLLVGEPGRPPLVASYLGLGRLEHWVRGVAGRQGRKALGREKREPVPDEELARRLIDPRAGAELDGAKQVYWEVFREAFRQAVSSLAPREGTLLRQRYADGLTLQQIAAVYGVHHETARRRLQAVHQLLLDETRRRMAERLGLSAEEFDTVMRTIGSRLDLTLRTFFGAG